MGTMGVIPSKCDEESNLFNKLCDELVAEIVARVAVTKTVVGFKVVCKRWYSIISSSYFTYLRHNKDNVESKSSSSLVFQFESSEFHIISDSSLLRNIYGDGGFSLSYLPCSPKDLRLEGSFDDLILCSSITSRSWPYKNHINYYVTNLLTRQWVALPLAPVLEEEGVSVGFLCSQGKDKFLVVRLHSGQYLEPFPEFQFKVQVFSSEHGQWRTFVISSSQYLQPCDFMSPFVAYRGMLHCLFADCIAVYDPFNTPESFSRIIQLPIHYSNDDYRCFGVCQGRFRLVAVSAEDARNLVVDVCEFENYDSGSWNLVNKFYCKRLTYNILHIPKERCESKSYLFSLASLHPKSGDEVYLWIGNGITLVNLKRKIIERYYPVTKNEVEFCRTNFFHLNDLWWPTPTPLPPISSPVQAIQNLSLQNAEDKQISKKKNKKKKKNKNKKKNKKKNNGRKAN